MRGMLRCWIIVLSPSLLAGCGEKIGRMERCEDPQGRYREQIEAAKRLLGQKEDWAERAEWEVLKSEDGWGSSLGESSIPNAKDLADTCLGDIR